MNQWYLWIYHLCGKRLALLTMNLLACIWILTQPGDSSPPRCSSFSPGWSIMSIWGNLRTVSCGNPEVALVLRPKLIGSHLSQVQGLNGTGMTNAAKCSKRHTLRTLPKHFTTGVLVVGCRVKIWEGMFYEWDSTGFTIKFIIGYWLY